MKRVTKDTMIRCAVDTVEEKMARNDCDTVDDMMAQAAALGDKHVDFCVALLGATYPHRARLKNRRALFDFIGGKLGLSESSLMGCAESLAV